MLDSVVPSLAPQDISERKWLRGSTLKGLCFCRSLRSPMASIPGTSMVAYGSPMAGGSGCVDVLDSVCMHDEQCLQNFASEYSLRCVLVAPEEHLEAVE